MKTSTMLLIFAVLAGCDARAKADNGPSQIKVLAKTDEVIVIHDDKRSVTCWIYDGYKAGGIYCMTDRSIGEKP